jgi:pyruvate dehydrogenase E1 component
MGQPGLTAYEPAHADELAAIMEWAFGHMQADGGGSVALRLSTRSLMQPARTGDAWRDGTIAGGYWLVPPAPGARLALVAMGAILPEALAAHAELSAEEPGTGLLLATSPDRLHRDWTAAQAARWQGGLRAPCHIETLLAPLASGARLVTVLDGSPAALSWLGGVRGMPVAALGTDRFGQTGDLPDLYRVYRLDADAILDAAAELHGS